jgi:hypothetical protein
MIWKLYFFLLKNPKLFQKNIIFEKKKVFIVLFISSLSFYYSFSLACKWSVKVIRGYDPWNWFVEMILKPSKSSVESDLELYFFLLKNPKLFQKNIIFEKKKVYFVIFFYLFFSYHLVFIRRKVSLDKKPWKGNRGKVIVER